MSGTSSSTAAEVTRVMPGCRPEPSCGNTGSQASGDSRTCAASVRHRASGRSRKHAHLRPGRCGEGKHPLPPMPEKKTGELLMPRPYWLGAASERASSSNDLALRSRYGRSLTQPWGGEHDMLKLGLATFSPARSLVCPSRSSNIDQRSAGIADDVPHAGWLECTAPAMTVTVLNPPETDLHVAIVEVKHAADAKGAATSACRLTGLQASGRSSS